MDTAKFKRRKIVGTELELTFYISLKLGVLHNIQGELSLHEPLVKRVKCQQQYTL